MADNRIRLKQLFTPELSGYIQSISSGEQGAQGAVGPAGTGLAPSGVDKSIQYRNGDQWGGSELYYDESTKNLGVAGATSPNAKVSYGEYSSLDYSTPTTYFHESGAGKKIGVNFNQTDLDHFIVTGWNSKFRFGTLSHLNAFADIFTISNDGEVGVSYGNLNVPSGGITGNGDIVGNKYGIFGSGILTSGTIIGSGYADLPTGSNYPGAAGEIAWGSGHFYVCTGANLWGRVALTGF